MARTLKDLLIAMLNATLILLALCLFLGWKLASTMNGITTNLTDNLQLAAPVREQAKGIREELAALRGELASLNSGTGTLDSATAQRIDAALIRLDGMEEKIGAVQARIISLAESPDQVIDHAIQTSADAVADRIIAIRGCVPQS